MAAFDAVVNLAGESLFAKRWSKKQKKILGESRWDATRTLAAGINSSQKPPKVFISGSAVGWYGSRDNAILDEKSGYIDGFLHRICKQWEKEAYAADNSTRLCIIRTGVVLSESGGMLSALKPMFKLGLGAVIGSGDQYISWIHIDDAVSAITYLLNNDSASGIYNMCSPEPVTNREFSRELAVSLGRPCFLRIPAFFMKFLLGERALLATEGQRVLPGKLENAGFNFKYRDIRSCLKQINA